MYENRPTTPPRVPVNSGFLPQPNQGNYENRPGQGALRTPENEYGNQPNRGFGPSSQNRPSSSSPNQEQYESQPIRPLSSQPFGPSSNVPCKFKVVLLKLFEFSF